MTTPVPESQDTPARKAQRLMSMGLTDKCPTCNGVGLVGPATPDTPDVAGVLAGHELLWGASQVGTFYAYCRCNEWSGTVSDATSVLSGYHAHLAAALSPVLAQVRKDAWDEGANAGWAAAHDVVTCIDGSKDYAPRPTNPYAARERTATEGEVDA